MFFKKSGEDKVIELIEEHLVLIKEVLTAFKEEINAFFNNCDGEKICDLSFDVHKKEHLADLKRKEIEKELLAGAFLPFYRENFLKIPEMIDEVAGQAVDIAKFLYLQNINFPPELKDYMRKLADGVIDTFDEFFKIFEFMPNDIDKVIQLTEEVSKAEQKTDSIEWEAKKYIFKKNNTLDKVDKVLSGELITQIADMADQIENSADYIFLTMMKMKI